MSIRFDNRVAIVTGAGGGLGRCHALELASRGAKVVVNDFGGSRDGTGGSSEMAEKAVEEIRQAGGEAIANGASVSDEAQVKNLVEQTLGEWGRIDILINNAGILRDKTFGKMTLEDFRAVVEVHLMGSVYCTHAVWPHMIEAEYGRILMTTSSSGLYGNFGQTNYGTAKLALVGLMNSLKLEGQKYNIHTNALAPVAATRMTEDLMPEEVLDRLQPQYVTPGAVFLVSEDAPTGAVLSAGAGVFARASIYETMGVNLGVGDDLSVENVAANWEKVCAPEGQRLLNFGGEQTMKIFELIQSEEKS